MQLKKDFQATEALSSEREHLVFLKMKFLHFFYFGWSIWSKLSLVFLSSPYGSRFCIKLLSKMSSRNVCLFPWKDSWVPYRLVAKRYGTGTCSYLYVPPDVGWMRLVVLTISVVSHINLKNVLYCRMRSLSTAGWPRGPSSSLEYPGPTTKSAGFVSLGKTFTVSAVLLQTFVFNLKVPSGQIGSKWELYHWKALEKDINRYKFLIFYFRSWIF